jgi:hypothetical protein
MANEETTQHAEGRHHRRDETEEKASYLLFQKLAFRGAKGVKVSSHESIHDSLLCSRVFSEISEITLKINQPKIQIMFKISWFRGPPCCDQSLRSFLEVS